MIGLDPNVLVRFLALDDASQSRQATEIVERPLTEANPGYISLVTIVETVWVLDRCLRDCKPSPRLSNSFCKEICSFVQDEQEAFTAMTALKAETGSFAEALIGALGAWAGCTTTLTFAVGHFFTAPVTSAPPAPAQAGSGTATSGWRYLITCLENAF